MTTQPNIFKHLLWGVGALFLLQAHAMAEPLWEWVNPRPQGNDLLSVASGEGVIVAVGSSGTILVSSDGAEWEVRAATTEYGLIDVTYGGGRFVAVGGKTGFEGSPGLGVYLSSEDGWHWEERHRTSYFTPEAVNWNGARFVAVGIAGRVLISEDGTTWSDHDLPALEWDLTDLVWDGSRYLAVGLENWFVGGVARFSSEDGLSWEQTAMDTDCVASAVTWADGRYVAVGGMWPWQACVLTSENGQDWDEFVFEEPGLLQDVVFANDQFLAVGLGGFVASSPDGYAWTVHEATSDDGLRGLTWADERWFAVGEDGVLLSSSDGLVWEHQSSRQLGFSHLVEIQEVVKGNGLFVGVGDYGRIITSPDGATWTQQSSPAPSSLESVIWTGAGFWAVGRYSVLWSPDGSQLGSGFDMTRMSIVWIFRGMARFLSLSEERVVPSQANHWFSRAPMASTGPITGSNLKAPWLPSSGPARGLWRLGIVVCSTRVFDGINWVRQPLDELSELRELAWNGDRLVAIGGISGTGSLVMTSSGDLEWEVVTPPEGVEIDFDDIVWTGNTVCRGRKRQRRCGRIQPGRVRVGIGIQRHRPQVECRRRRRVHPFLLRPGRQDHQTENPVRLCPVAETTHGENLAGIVERTVSTTGSVGSAALPSSGYGIGDTIRDCGFLYGVVSKRYENRPVLVTAAKSFAEWSEVFPSATCVTTIIDRLVHRCEVVQAHAESH